MTALLREQFPELPLRKIALPSVGCGSLEQHRAVEGPTVRKPRTPLGGPRPLGGHHQGAERRCPHFRHGTHGALRVRQPSTPSVG
ncbi:hypothetical protein HRI_005287900 [Hibiscus trionum]|uniref:Uncharacterized protein n=1 Tax=Hibiscus trionum TaxID=183268 RepID=A0A9W7JJM0_HIBTR|nr:hypothetical protein HRI_005247700 [Hibiscus trionum]GMJ15786.1 hypothetical protein HRI_005247800 [Hibiscus trionum]GMJ16180.1 hypothetical protein HRI_005287200 [Hibiscus trionum]GMJ16187.1 hypothetical protein HRI_005287900 [Hibiscus trionum]